MTAERRGTRSTSTCPAPLVQHADVVIEGVDGTAEDVPRKPRSGADGASHHRATKSPGVNPKGWPPSQCACALPSSSTPPVPYCVSLSTAHEEVCKQSLHSAIDKIECRRREYRARVCTTTRTAPRRCTDPGWMWRATSSGGHEIPGCGLAPRKRLSSSLPPTM